MSEDETEAQETTTAKRGRGRPPTTATAKRGRGRPPTTATVKAQRDKAWLDGKRYAKGETVEIPKPRVSEVTATGVWKEA